MIGVASVSLARAFLVLFFVEAAQASDQLPTRKAQLLLTSHCTRLNTDRSLKECFEAAEESLDRLDLYFLEGNSSRFVFFYEDLIDLAKKDSTIDYIKFVTSRIEQADAYAQKMNLWSETLEYFDDKLTALRHIAVLFQDTGATEIHVDFLSKVIEGESHKILYELSHLLSLLRNQEILRDALEVFPPLYQRRPMEPLCLYYFYLGAYLSSKTTSSDLTTSFFILMSALFKYQRIQPGSYSYLFPDFTQELGDFRIRTIYSSYLGPSWYQGKSRIITYDWFKSALQSEEKDLFRYLFR